MYIKKTSLYKNAPMFENHRSVLKKCRDVYSIPLISETPKPGLSDGITLPSTNDNP